MGAGREVPASPGDPVTDSVPCRRRTSADCSRVVRSRPILWCGVTGSAIGQRFKALSSAASLLMMRRRYRAFRLVPRHDTLAEICNCLVFGVIPLFVALALAVGTNIGH
jgi:hypothetical protein